MSKWVPPTPDQRRPLAEWIILIAGMLAIGIGITIVGALVFRFLGI